MKEKTFEELALELASARFWDNGDEFIKTAANLMQQVREATIAECEDLVNKSNKHINPFSGEVKITLPTDRIEIKE